LKDIMNGSSDNMKKIRVLIIDDSAVVRDTLRTIFESDPQIVVLGAVIDPYFAVEKMKEEAPDVITLDVEMPRMDGITFLKKIMTQHPIPVVMCSSLTVDGCATTLQALEYGAVDIITKPKIGVKNFLEESRINIIDIIKAASMAKVKSISGKLEVSKKLTADAILKPVSGSMIHTTEKIIAVGASTGGTEALREFLMNMPLDCPGIAVVQHMPENFTRSFAQRLNIDCDIEVKEAEDGDRLIRGRALIAPGNKHMMICRSGAKYCVQIKSGPLICRHRPSVDVLFRSAAQYAGVNSIGVIMTGMGDDGARGMKEMKDAGAYNIAQNEESCVVFGMPNEAIKLGAADKVLHLRDIAGEVIRVGNL